MTWFDEVITPTERKEAEESVRQVNLILLRGRLVCAYLPELIDQRFDRG